MHMLYTWGRLGHCKQKENLVLILVTKSAAIRYSLVH